MQRTNITTLLCQIPNSKNTGLGKLFDAQNFRFIILYAVEILFKNTSVSRASSPFTGRVQART